MGVEWRPTGSVLLWSGLAAPSQLKLPVKPQFSEHPGLLQAALKTGHSLRSCGNPLPPGPSTVTHATGELRQ